MKKQFILINITGIIKLLLASIEIYLKETKKETEKKIKSGEYILTNLN